MPAVAVAALQDAVAHAMERAVKADTAREVGAGGAGRLDMTRNHLLRIASRLAQIPTGSAAADQIIHEALGRAEPVLPYTINQSAAAQLLPPGFEWMPPIHSFGRAYAPCRRSSLDGEWRHPRHGQWAATLPLSLGGAALRAWAKLAKG